MQNISPSPDYLRHIKPGPFRQVLRPDNAESGLVGRRGAHGQRPLAPRPVLGAQKPVRPRRVVQHARGEARRRVVHRAIEAMAVQGVVAVRVAVRVPVVERAVAVRAESPLEKQALGSA